MKSAKRQRSRKHRAKIVNETLHLRLSEDDRKDVVAIARSEHKDYSDTMRCLIKLGVKDYRVTGTLYVIEKEEEPADEWGKEHRAILDQLRRYAQAVRNLMSRGSAKSKPKADQTERRTEWQQVQNK